MTRTTQYLNLPYAQMTQGASARHWLWRNGFRYCLYCHKKLVFEGVAEKGSNVLTVDHVIPRSKGGTWARKNLAAACFDCNMDKKDLSIRTVLAGIGSSASERRKLLEEHNRKEPDAQELMRG